MLPIQGIQNTAIMFFPWLVLSVKMEDGPMVPDPLQIDLFISGIGVMEADQTVGEVVAQGVGQFDMVAVHDGQDVLIRQDEAAHLLHGSLAELLQSQILPEQRQVHHHHAGVYIGNILLHAQTTKPLRE